MAVGNRDTLGLIALKRSEELGHLKPQRSKVQSELKKLLHGWQGERSQLELIVGLI